MLLWRSHMYDIMPQLLIITLDVYLGRIGTSADNLSWHLRNLFSKYSLRWYRGSSQGITNLICSLASSHTVQVIRKEPC
jgi:hypothetical protein